MTLAAEERGISPEQISSKYKAEFIDNWERLGISFDLFTTTHTQNHTEVAQDIFLTLHKKGDIYLDTMLQPYCETDRRFLADRYVEGTCPNCGAEGARGDQCDSCGRTLDPQDLIDMVCKICGNSPVIRETEHFFLKLSAFEERLLEWARAQAHWRPNVRNFTIGFLEGGLHDRAITRDIEWGVPVPLDGYEGKRIYVWFEAVIGYLSATKEWAQRENDPDRWKDFWQKECRAYYFIGQGQHTLPHHHLAGHVDGLRRTQPALRRARQRVPESGGDSSYPPAATGPSGSPIIWTGTRPTPCVTSWPPVCPRPATQISRGVSTSGATTTSW